MATSKKTPRSKAAHPSNDREKALREALAAIEKSHGTGSVIQMTGDYITAVRGISSGSLALDLALGGRGLPRGRVVELYGPEGSGKSTLALSAIAQAQLNGGYAAYIDAEHAFDPEYARALGVNLDGLRFNLSQPSYGEEGLDIVEHFVKSNAVDIVVVDSVAALVPKAEIDGEIGDTFVGLQARMMSQALRRLTVAIGKTDCVVLFINQLREKIGVMFGNPETTPGGRALKFYSSVRIDVRRIGALKQGDEIIGNRTKATVVKNKVAPPFRRAEFDILYGRGVSYEGDLIELGLQAGLISKAGAWFSCKLPDQEELRLGQGKEAVRQLLIDNPDLASQLRNHLLEDLGSKVGNRSIVPGSASPTSDPGAEKPTQAEAGRTATSGAKGAAPSPGRGRVPARS